MEVGLRLDRAKAVGLGLVLGLAATNLEEESPNWERLRKEIASMSRAMWGAVSVSAAAVSEGAKNAAAGAATAAGTANRATGTAAAVSERVTKSAVAGVAKVAAAAGGTGGTAGAGMGVGTEGENWKVVGSEKA